MTNLRKYLVISTIGQDSLHQFYCSDNREFDVMLVAYDRDAYDKFQGDGDLLVYKQGRKFELIHHYLKDKELNYDYYLFLDDDILTTAEDLNKFFAICRQYQTKISHPAVIGYNHHQLLKPDNNYLLTFTDWVELQAVCFRRDKLAELLDTFTENKSGYGLPELWWKRSITPWGEDLRLFAIINEVVVNHTRPYGQTYELSEAVKEIKELYKKHNIESTKKAVLARVYKGRYSVVIIFSQEDQKHIQKCLDTVPPEAEIILVKTVPVSVDESYHSGRLWYKDWELTNVTKGVKHTFAEFHYLDVEDSGIIPDFSAARNAAKSLATREWILSLDADERLITDQHELINEAIEHAPGDIGGFISGNVSNIANVKDEKGMFRNISRQVRLFRNLNGLDWTGRGHETVEFSIEELGLKIQEIPLCLFHTGYNTDYKTMEAKLNRNLDRMLKDGNPMRYKELIKREVKALTKFEEKNNGSKSTIPGGELLRGVQSGQRRIHNTPVYL